MRYKIDLGGTNLRVYEDDVEIYAQACNGNINLNPDLYSELDKVLNSLQIEADVLIGIAGYYSCSQLIKDDLELQLNGRLKDFKVVSDAEFHAMQLITEDQLLVSLGTGSVGSYFKQSDFKLLGGYGHLIGDLGSGYHFGKVVIQSYLNDYEANLSLPYMEAVERYFGVSGRQVLTEILSQEKQKCSKLAKAFMDNPQFEEQFKIYFKQFETELQRMVTISAKQTIIINGSITNSIRFKQEIKKMKLNIIIK